MENLTGEELLSQGWTRRFTIESERAAEFIEQYGEIGFEAVAVAPSVEDLDGLCGQDCFDGAREHYRTIYTRDSQAGKRDNDVWV